jgi:hypothetical protein
LFSIENKCGYNEIEIGKLISVNPQIKTIGEFIEQACTDAVRSSRIPLIIYSKDYRDPIAVIPLENHERSDQYKKVLEKIGFYIVFEYKLESFPQWEKWGISTLDQLIKNSEKDFFFSK